MKRWWLINETETAGKGDCKSKSLPSEVSRKWTFRVILNRVLDPREIIAVSGSCDSLGNWNVSQALQLMQNGGNVLQNNCIHVNKIIKKFIYLFR